MSSTCTSAGSFVTLELPDEFEDVRGLLESNLRAIVAIVTNRAHERLFLTAREHSSLQVETWNRLVEVIEATVEPLSAENR